jgi:hypothetical protein
MSMLYIQIFSIIMALAILAGTIIDYMRFGWFGKSLMFFYTTMSQVFLSVFVLSYNLIFPRWQGSSSLLVALSFELAFVILLCSAGGEQTKQKRASTRIPIIAGLLAINFFDFHQAILSLFIASIILIAWYIRQSHQYTWRSMLMAQLFIIPTIFLEFHQMATVLLTFGHFIFLRRCINASLIKTVIADKIEQ